MPGILKGMAYGQQRQNYGIDSSGPSTETAVPTTRYYHGPEASTVMPDDNPTSNTLTSGYPIASSGSGSETGDQKGLYGGESYPQSPPTFSQYYNASSNLRPSGAYGTAVSSGFPWSNYSSHQQTAVPTSGRCNCPQPSVVTVQNTITVQDTVTAPPLTITMTSTVSVTADIPPQTTPTVTIAITTTVCAGAGQNNGYGQNTAKASNIAQAATSLTGGQESGVEYSTGSDFVESPPSVTNEAGPVNGKNPVPSAFVTGGMSPQVPVPAVSSQSNQSPFTNEIGFPGASSPLGTGMYQIPQSPETSSPGVLQPQPTGLPVETGGYASVTSSYGGPQPSLPPNSPPAPSPTSNERPYGSGEESAQANSTTSGQQRSELYPAPSMVASSEAQTVENAPNTSVSPLPLMTYGGGSASPSNSSDGQGSIASGSIGTPEPPPYAYNNGTSLAPGPTNYPPNYGTGSAPPPTLPAPTGQALASSQQNFDTSNAAPYPTSNAGYTSQDSGFPAPTFPIQSSSSTPAPFANLTSSSLPPAPFPGTGIPYQPDASPSPPYQNSILPSPPPVSEPPNPQTSSPFMGNDSTVVLESGSPSPSVSNPLPPFVPSGTWPVYSTKTQMVVPYPMTSPTNSSPAPGILPSPSGDSNPTTPCSTTASDDGSFSTWNTPSLDQSPTPPPLPNNSSLGPELLQPQESGLDMAMPTSSTTPLPPPAPTGAPIASSPMIASSQMPIPPSPPPPAVSSSSFIPVPSSSLPPAAGTSAAATGPSCSPTVKDDTYNVDFNTFTINQPLPTPYGPLIYSGFTIDNGSPTPHLTSPADATAKSIAIGPSTDHFTLTSLTLACSIPPCNITMIGIKAPGTTAQGAAAGGIAYKTVRVEAADHGADSYTAVDGFGD
ncbi:MAG: hypothetical protein Q9228_003719, partial [Teloschistes exilis]